ncbi:MAG: DUF1905 domain-containing protein [Marinifilaceae bacterium]
MESIKKFEFSARIYRTGINWCVDVPGTITNLLIAERGRIRIKGQINGFDFTKTLMPVKNSAHRLFVNQVMMKGGKTALGEVATFVIEQDYNREVKVYPMPELLVGQLEKYELTADFNNLTPSRRKSILKYLSYIKTEATLLRNINKLVVQLRTKEKNVRIP